MGESSSKIKRGERRAVQQFGEGEREIRRERDERERQAQFGDGSEGERSGDEREEGETGVVRRWERGREIRR
ncbi:hypothetical protein AAC387_Pa06g0323 [Persea americana]